MATEKVKIKLQGHEKFALREGWVNKALMLLPDNSDAFTRKDATDLFGIGSNMVKSLRYWMRAFGLTNTQGTELSEVGKLIAEYDPYLENMFSLWIMHSYIAKNKEDATTWFMFFNRCDANDMDKNEIESILLREVRKYAAGTSFSEKSLSNDVDVLLNMYSKSKDKVDPEDKSVSPFAQLAMIKKMDGRYMKNHPSKALFPEEVVLYELATRKLGSEGVSIEEVVFGEGGLNKIFNMTAVMANDYFDRLDAAGYIRVDRTAGLDMIYPVKVFDELMVIENYYKKN
ncbi:MAG: DUF4007 family protein [Lachnospiraceae bacterium]|nr:DUF4007 family protein [Lachnospiraceae bacterium]MEE1518096.1 DUF4007 family protein [Lachnospiraceae bacterium]